MVRRVRPQVAVFIAALVAIARHPCDASDSVALYAAPLDVPSSPARRSSTCPRRRVRSTTGRRATWSKAGQRRLLAVRRQRGRHPLIVSGGGRPRIRSAELVAQLAVLLGGDAADQLQLDRAHRPISRTRLNAANVGVFDSRHETSRARFGAGWIYFAPAERVASPFPWSRRWRPACPASPSIRHTPAGAARRRNRLSVRLAARNDRRIATLIDSPQLRASWVQAAREAPGAASEWPGSTSTVARCLQPDRMSPP